MLSIVTKIIDLGRPWTADTHSITEKRFCSWPQKFDWR